VSSLDTATRLMWFGAASFFMVTAVLTAGVAWVVLTRRLDERRWAIRDRDDAVRERSLLDQLAPAPDGTVPPESLAVGRARLAADLRTPDPNELQVMFDAPSAEENPS
jgi:hypothetical protein